MTKSVVAYTKLNNIEVLISRAFINLYINRDELVSVNNVLRGYGDMKVGAKHLTSSSEIIIY